MKSKLVLGLSFSHNSSASLVGEDYHVHFASSEERVYSKYNDHNFVKGTKRFPIGAVTASLNVSSVDITQIHTVAWTHYESPDLYNFTYKCLSPQIRKTLLAIPRASEILCMVAEIQSPEELSAFRQRYPTGTQLAFINVLISLLLKELFGIQAEKVVRIDHHLCHAYGALKTSGFTDGALVITLDGFGDNVSGQVYDVVNDRLIRIPSNTVLEVGSPGLFYQYVTGYIRLQGGHRLKMLRDEYKLLALEPYSKRHYPLFYNLIDNEISDEKNTIVWSSEVTKQSQDQAHCEYHPVRAVNALEAAQEYFELLLRQAELDGYSEFDIARAAQTRFEEVVLKWVETAIGQRKCIDLALSGGCFYNVKLNYQIKQLEQVRKLWIYPASGDEGNSLGAAYAYIAEHEHPASHRVSHVYFGQRFSADDALQAVAFINRRFGVNLSFEEFENTNEMLCKVSTLLADKNIVHLANLQKGVEFGPRALLVRSTLSHATDRTVNEAIQVLFQRYQYMPLAPVMKVEKAEACLVGFKNETDREIAKYMILAYPCVDEFSQQYPAVVHPYHQDDIQKFGVSCSTRPQLVSRDDYPFAWDLLDRYEAKTGEIALLNTSLNSHNSPILGTPVVLLLDWLSMKGESYLVLDNILFGYKTNLETVEKVQRSWIRTKKFKSAAYELSKKSLLQ